MRLVSKVFMIGINDLDGLQVLYSTPVLGQLSSSSISGPGRISGLDQVHIGLDQVHIGLDQDIKFILDH